MAWGTAVHPQLKRAVERTDRNIDASIVVEIGKRSSTMQARHCKSRSCIGGDIEEFAMIVA